MTFGQGFFAFAKTAVFAAIFLVGIILAILAMLLFLFGMFGFMVLGFHQRNYEGIDNTGGTSSKRFFAWGVISDLITGILSMLVFKLTFPDPISARWLQVA